MDKMAEANAEVLEKGAEGISVEAEIIVLVLEVLISAFALLVVLKRSTREVLLVPSLNVLSAEPS